MDSHLGPVNTGTQCGLNAAVNGWRDVLSPDRVEVLSEKLKTDEMTEREKQLIRALRKAIEDDPRTLNAIALDAGLAASVVWRFVGRQRGLSIEATAALAETLKLELTRRKGRSRGG